MRPDPDAGPNEGYRLGVLSYVDDCAVWVTYEEAAESPVLIRERVDDLGSGVDSPIMDGVDVIDLNGDVWMNVGFDIERHNAELDFSPVGAEEENPVEAASFFEPDDVPIKGSALLEAIGPDVRLDPFDGHIRSLEPSSDPRTAPTSSSRQIRIRSGAVARHER
jgi:hypothetical protein